MKNLASAAELVDLLGIHDNSGRSMRRVILIKQQRILRLQTKNGLAWWEVALSAYLPKPEF